MNTVILIVFLLGGIPLVCVVPLAIMEFTHASEAAKDVVAKIAIAGAAIGVLYFIILIIIVIGTSVVKGIGASQ